MDISLRYTHRDAYLVSHTVVVPDVAGAVLRAGDPSYPRPSGDGLEPRRCARLHGRIRQLGCDLVCRVECDSWTPTGVGELPRALCDEGPDGPPDVLEPRSAAVGAGARAGSRQFPFGAIGGR